MGADGTLRVARRQALLTQTELARRARVNVNTIRKLEVGGVPYTGTAVSIAAALDVTPQELWPSLKIDANDPPARRMRKERQLTTRQVIEATGLTHGVVYRADRGGRLSLSSLQVLAKFYDVHPDAIQSPLTQDPGSKRWPTKSHGSPTAAAARR